ncbi:MAG: AAA family ATPase [Clostridia bacterium]|nr:AAA family ATPase [Clostridia bacterium]
MRLLRLHVDNFGTLCNFDLSFETGMNVLYQKNGWGKSTLAVFIKAMLYGLPATSKRSLDENERKKYTPWQGGSYGGTLEIETSKGRFRIERSFGAKESGDSFALFDLSTNLPSTQYSTALGEELFGIDADGFERSTYLSQRMLTGGKDNNSISAKLGNLLDDVGDIGNYDVAVEALDRRRRYYVMTGNRGAIAEMEQEIYERQAELERCLRVEEALRAQEVQLADFDDQLAALHRASEENRERMKRAGLARERAALVERRQQMTAELTALRERLSRLRLYFDGEPPAQESLETQKQLWGQINAARARMDMIAADPDAALLRLRERFSMGVPKEEELARAERDQETLRDLRIRCEMLRSACDDRGQTKRFSRGLPNQAAIERAFERLSVAERAQKESEALRLKEDRAQVSRLPAAVTLLMIGLLIAVLGFLPALHSVQIPFLIGGAAIAAIGFLMGIGVLRSRAKRMHEKRALQTGLARLREQREQALREVRELLTAYSMPTDDPARALTELSLLAERERESQQQIRRLSGDLEALDRRRKQIGERLHAYLARFFAGLEQKADYTAELERLRRDSSALLQAEAVERRRASDRATAEGSLRELQLRLQPFLKKHDPEKRLRAGECLERVSEQTVEYHRLSREIARKEPELADFVREKGLDQPSDTEDVTAIDRLGVEERELQARISDLERRRATAKSSMERLQTDVDHIPEIEAHLAQMKLRLAEAKANAETIKTTASFLEEAKNALSTRYLGDMQTSFGRFLSDLIGGEAPEAVMNASFEVGLRPDGGQTRSMESFSRGWRDAVELCVRLSLTDALYKDGEKPFLLLDDPLVNLDDDRLTAARGLLDRLSERYQILYLVCHRDRI